jgi:hypothetical protein
MDIRPNEAKQLPARVLAALRTGAAVPCLLVALVSQQRRASVTKHKCYRSNTCSSVKRARSSSDAAAFVAM